MISKVVSVSCRIGLTATRTTLGLSVKLAGELVKVVQSRFPSSPPAQSSAPPAKATTPAEPSPDPAPRRGTLRVEDGVPAPDEQPLTPITPRDAHLKTVDDSDPVVAEFAEPGAEDGAGAALRMEEPWPGYDSEDIDSLTARIADAEAATLAFLGLYEQANQQRRGVLDAAAQRLAELSPPDAA